MTAIRGKPPTLYTYRQGRKVLLSMLPSLRKRKTYGVQGERPGPIPAQRARFKVAQQNAAAQNLQALHRPLKPPSRRSP